jgi:hypothetical protein
MIIENLDMLWHYEQYYYVPTQIDFNQNRNISASNNLLSLKFNNKNLFETPEGTYIDQNQHIFNICSLGRIFNLTQSSLINNSYWLNIYCFLSQKNVNIIHVYMPNLCFCGFMYHNKNNILRELIYCSSVPVHDSLLQITNKHDRIIDKHDNIWQRTVSIQNTFYQMYHVCTYLFFAYNHYI